jgi:hypothetical protein
MENSIRESVLAEWRITNHAENRKRGYIQPEKRNSCLFKEENTESSGQNLLMTEMTVVTNYFLNNLARKVFIFFCLSARARNEPPSVAIMKVAKKTTDQNSGTTSISCVEC